MSRATAATLAATIALMAGIHLNAQTRTIPGEHRTETVTVEKVDVASRRVTLRTPSGELRTITAPPEAKRLAELKPGSVVSVTFEDNLVVRAKPKGEPDVDTLKETATPAKGATPGGAVVSKRTLTATVTAINQTTRSISLSGPRGWRHQTTVRDPQVLQELKVGDRIDLTWTEATVVSIEPGKK